MSILKHDDPEVWGAIQAEKERQQNTIDLIAAENICSLAVQEAQGSLMTNKYAEGYARRRWYAGCGNVDEVEELAVARAKQIFGAEHVNVQPHAGSQANMAVCFAMLKPGDRILGMDLSHGGHLTHGFKKNFSGTMYDIAQYGVRKDTGYIDYDEVRSIAVKTKPKMIIAGASAYPRVLDFPRFQKDCRRGWRLIYGGHSPYCGTCCRRRSSQPDPLCGFCHLYNPQDASGAARRYDHVQVKICKTDRLHGFPGHPGWPVYARHRSQGCCI